MNDKSRVGKVITLEGFEEQPLASGRKLLQCVFKSRWGNEYYRWTPPWKDKSGQYGVERLFFKALEVEEWNDPEGVWTDELKRAADEVPPLNDLKLPVAVKCSGLATLNDSRWDCKIDICILEDGAKISGDWTQFRIGECEFNYERFKDDFQSHFSERWMLGVSKTFESLWEGGESSYGYTTPEQIGVKFSVWVPHGIDKQLYRSLGRELAFFVRTSIRQILANYKTIKTGFES